MSIDVDCSGCVDPEDVSFSYAGSATQGGPATSALTADSASDLACSGCVSDTEVAFNVCIADEYGNAVYAGEAGDADSVDGYHVDTTGAGQPHTIPLLDNQGKLPLEVLPFNQGDLLAPADRLLVQGLDSYLLDYFHIANLGVNGLEASNVKQGVTFGPGNTLTGTMVQHDSFGWWANPDMYEIYDDFSRGIDYEKWEFNQGSESISNGMLNIGCGTAWPAVGRSASSKNFPPNHHIAFIYRIHSVNGCGGGSINILGVEVAQQLAYHDSDQTVGGTIFVEALGNDEYTIYHGMEFIQNVSW